DHVRRESCCRHFAVVLGDDRIEPGVPQQGLNHACRNLRRRKIPGKIVFARNRFKSFKADSPTGRGIRGSAGPQDRNHRSSLTFRSKLVAEKGEGTYTSGYRTPLSSSLNRRIIMVWPKLRRKETTDADTRRERAGDAGRTGHADGRCVAAVL